MSRSSVAKTTAVKLTDRSFVWQKNLKVITKQVVVLTQSTHNAIYLTQTRHLFTLSHDVLCHMTYLFPKLTMQLLFLNVTRWQQCSEPKPDQRLDAGEEKQHRVNSQNITWCPLVEAQKPEKKNQQDGLNKTQQAPLMHDSNSGYQQLIQLNIFDGVFSSPENHRALSFKSSHSDNVPFSKNSVKRCLLYIQRRFCSACVWRGCIVCQHQASHGCILPQYY